MSNQETENLKLEGLELITQAPVSKIPSTLKNILGKDPRADEITELLIIHEGRIELDDETENLIEDLTDYAKKSASLGGRATCYIFGRYGNTPKHRYFLTSQSQEGKVEGGITVKLPNVKQAIKYLSGALIGDKYSILIQKLINNFGIQESPFNQEKLQTLMELNPRIYEAVSYLVENQQRTITTRKYRDLTNASDSTSYRDLSKLVEVGLLKRGIDRETDTPSKGRAAFYEINV
jgi:hypothetical protein